VVDVDRLARLLDHIGRDTERLSHSAERDRHELLADPTALDAVKYRFVTALEGCLRVAHHVSASEGWGAPDTNAESMRLLARHGVLRAETAEQMARAVGFRNVLVHQYAEVRDDLVADRLGNLDDLAAFVRQVAAWVRRQD
jgi:uncharacterized protein YutE (UPF0331/DUF86 family)